MRRNFNWNRKWIHGERTSAGNEPFMEREGWRRGSRTDQEFEGGRRVDVGKESSKSQHENPSLKGEVLVGGKGLGQDGSLGLIPVGLQESVKIDNSLPKKMNLGLDDVSQVTKSGTKRD
ncbi:hypothetical protein Q3G72_019809 [Acer saccharum]|nr:hypothetical protein Q3G72_019809 [Acer saccharum]